MKKIIALAILATATIAAQAAGPATVAGAKVFYDQPCMGSRGQDGFVVTRGERTGCMDADHSESWRIQWDDNDQVERVPSRLRGYSRKDFAAELNKPRFDAYGRPMKSVDELCAEARAAGGPVTQICAMNNWAK